MERGLHEYKRTCVFILLFYGFVYVRFSVCVYISVYKSVFVCLCFRMRVYECVQVRICIYLRVCYQILQYKAEGERKRKEARKGKGGGRKGKGRKRVQKFQTEI